jgi:hypothetical protein
LLRPYAVPGWRTDVTAPALYLSNRTSVKYGVENEVFLVIADVLIAQKLLPSSAFRLVPEVPTD